MEHRSKAQNYPDPLIEICVHTPGRILNYFDSELKDTPSTDWRRAGIWVVRQTRVPFLNPKIVRHPYKKEPPRDPNSEKCPCVRELSKRPGGLHRSFFPTANGICTRRSAAHLVALRRIFNKARREAAQYEPSLLQMPGKKAPGRVAAERPEENRKSVPVAIWLRQTESSSLPGPRAVLRAISAQREISVFAGLTLELI